ncbi:helix-turn-helix domain-containing protein [Streptosporangium nondiastaticum]|uniref:helix-turn-helix domain-containing protein n=1 Tax=Streptosporangium nondiastaticum TaxID=35764 RepID=UPI0031F979C8
MSIGGSLAEARQAAGMTVGQLSARTRVREALIHAMERDDFSHCGGDFYARGHIRNISKVLGLDPEAMVHEYDELHGGVPLPVRAASVFQADKPINIRERRSPNWTMAMGVALAILVVFGVVKMMGGEETPSADIRPAKKSAAPHSAHARPLAGGQRRAGAALAPKQGEVVLQITARRPSWLDVKDSAGRRLFSGRMTAGQASVWRAQKALKVTFGDAGAFSVRMNGVDLGVPGSGGEVLKHSYKASKP